jgi:hypothetical protein
MALLAVPDLHRQPSLLLTMASRKIPEHVARELRRHVVKPSSSSNNNNKKAYVLLGCVTFTAMAAALPYYATRWIGNLNARDDPLTAAQVRRGAYTNSGTRDVGRDPQWDFKSGTYKRDDEFREMLRDNNPNQIEHGDELVRKTKR